MALRYDKSTEVRLKALNGLKPYVAEDMRVRDAVLEALMADPDATVRSRAIELLQPVGADSSVREVLHTVASQDDNPSHPNGLPGSFGRIPSYTVAWESLWIRQVSAL